MEKDREIKDDPENNIESSGINNINSSLLEISEDFTKDDEKSSKKRKFPDINYKKILTKRLPIITWLPKYNISTFVQDSLAGFSVALASIPQGVAFAIVAGLEPQYGLYSVFMGCFAYTILGSCKDVNIGPTAIMGLMVQPHVTKFGADASILLAFLTGCIIFVLGVLNLGVVVQFFSYPVVAGFTSGAAIQIASTQMSNLLGIPKKTNQFLSAWSTVFKNLNLISFWDALMGITSIITLALMKNLSKYGSLKYNPNISRRRNYIGRFLWLLALGRNALVVLVCSLIAYGCEKNDYHPIRLTGNITEGLPDFKSPNFNINFNNQTYYFPDVISSFGTTIVFLPLNCILGAIAIAKAFSKGKSLDATQELLALGMSNILGSFVSSMPVTGSFTRTAVNNASGVQTPFGGAITGVLILLAMISLSSSFYYMPKASLSAVIIYSMINLFEYDALTVLWRTKKSDFYLHLLTLLCCVFLGLEYGILIGISVNLILILYSHLKPPILIEKFDSVDSDVYIVTPRRLQFPGAEYMRLTIMKNCGNSNTIIVIDAKYISELDSTIAKNLKILANDLLYFATTGCDILQF